MPCTEHCASCLSLDVHSPCICLLEIGHDQQLAQPVLCLVRLTWSSSPGLCVAAAWGYTPLVPSLSLWTVGYQNCGEDCVHLNLSGEVPSWLVSLHTAARWMGQAASRYMLGMVLFHILVRNLPPA